MVSHGHQYAGKPLCIECSNDPPLRDPVQRQRVALKPDQAHAARLPAGQDGLDDGGLQQGQAQQFIHRRVLQSLTIGNVGATGHHAVVE